MNYLVDQGVEGTEIVYRGDTFDILSTLAIGWEWTDRSLSISYVTGIDKPNYPVPAIPIRVGYQPQDDGWQIYPSAYWFISSKQLCWSFWKKWENMTIDRGRN